MSCLLYTSYAEQRAGYAEHLYAEGASAARQVPVVPATYASTPVQVRGFEVLQANFDAQLARDPRILIFGEDVGRMGDVNQGVAGLQAKYGARRVADAGIREATIVGQAIGYALRGLRPVSYTHLGFVRRDDGPGYDLYTAPGWDYAHLVDLYTQAAHNARVHHIPALVHVTEMTQPQGHSTSGSHKPVSYTHLDVYKRQLLSC